MSKSKAFRKALGRSSPNMALTSSVLHAARQQNHSKESYAAMPQDEAGRFREKADECREQAAKAIGAPDKELWLRVAEEWLKLAMSAEERK
jgi:hypothetical protein